MSQTEQRYTAKDAADYLGLTAAAVYAAKSKGRLSFEMQGGSLLFTREALDTYRESTSLALSQPAVTEEEAVPMHWVRLPGEKLPICHYCTSIFTNPAEFVLQKFLDEAGNPYWWPVCSDKHCDPAHQREQQAHQEQRKLHQVLLTLKEHRAALDALIVLCEEQLHT